MLHAAEKRRAWELMGKIKPHSTADSYFHIFNHFCEDIRENLCLISHATSHVYSKECAMPLIPRKFPPWGGGLFEVCSAVLLSHDLPNVRLVWWFYCAGIRTPPQVSPQMLSTSNSKVFLFHRHLVKHGKTFSHWSTSKGAGFSSSFRFPDTLSQQLFPLPLTIRIHLQHTSACPPAVTLKHFFPT